MVDPVALMRCDFTLSTMSAMRRQLRREAMACGLVGGRLEDFVVAVNEIAANAVLHGGGSGRLALWRSGTELVCEIADRGAGIPRGQLENATEDLLRRTGRGLLLARALAGSLTISHDAGPAVVRLSTVLPDPA
jgi:Anti-sigma regulatory factor (Ser/Thr protein kinase)